MAVNSMSFDAQFYATTYPDVAAAVSRGEFSSFQEHYNLFGRFESRDPNAFFDTSYYLGQYPDVAEAGVNPFIHFQQFGASEGRFFNASEQGALDTNNNGVEDFDDAAYLAANQDVKADAPAQRGVIRPGRSGADPIGPAGAARPQRRLHQRRKRGR